MYPNQVAVNQFGETSNQFIKGGSLNLNLNFKVAASDSGGFGLTGLSASQGIAAAYMHTSASPASGSPAPLAGYLAIKLTAAFAGFLGFKYGIQSPISGTPISITSGVTAGQLYTIQTLGTTTAANWQAIGLPTTVTPAVGVAFIASVTGNGLGTGTVEVPLATGSTTTSIEAVGASGGSPQGNPGWLYFQFLAPTSSSSTVPKAANPADGSIVTLDLSLLPQVGAPIN